ncbi:MAG: polyprenol monophosphomannose synthase [bacterium]|nr:polyprenol monophosphomannose synthase [bacterium]
MDWIITPTYNERNNIRKLIDQIFVLYPAINVLVVDDNSPDGTALVVKEIQAKYPRLHLKERAGKLGLASAYLESIQEILDKHSDVRNITTMDADLSHNRKVVGTMLKELEIYDLVLGSRYIKGGGVKNWELWRRILSRGGNFYACMVTMSSVRDLTTGFHCYRATLLRLYDLKAIKATGFGFLMEMKIVAERLGARIKETPIIFPGRTDGQSKLSNHIIYEGLMVPWRFSPLVHYFLAIIKKLS